MPASLSGPNGQITNFCISSFPHVRPRIRASLPLLHSMPIFQTTSKPKRSSSHRHLSGATIYKSLRVHIDHRQRACRPWEHAR
ncbi:hypothetical protein M3J09_010968 [Ascochyta lentis]